MSAAEGSGRLADRLAKEWRAAGALPAGIAAGGIFGALVGGVGGRIVMRIIFVIDRSTDGANTDFGTVGEITVGGSFTLLVLSTIAGVIGGALYVLVRRWLPRPQPARGVFFGLLTMFGPGIIAISETDLSIFEPALPIYAMFVGLVVLYGAGVALLTDRLHAQTAVRPGRRRELAARAVLGLAAVGIVIMAGLAANRINDRAGSCLSVDQNTGGCAAPAED